MKTVIYKKQMSIAIIKFNRPEVLNAYNDELMKDLIAAFELARRDKEIRAIVWKGEGRAWCAGADIKLWGMAKEIGGWRALLELENESTRLIMRLGKPIVAAIRGYALGGGCEYAMLADIRIAAEDARFGFPETSLGGVITHAGTKILPQLIGLGKAKELILANEIIDAREAERIGLVNKVVALDELDDVAMSMAQKIASNPPYAVIEMKKALERGFDWDYEAALECETSAGLLSRAAGETEEGYGAWAERQKSKKS